MNGPAPTMRICFHIFCDKCIGGPTSISTQANVGGVEILIYGPEEDVKTSETPGMPQLQARAPEIQRA